MKRYLFILFALVLVFSCKKEGTGSGDHNEEKRSFPITGDCDGVGMTSARLYGWCYQEESEGQPVEYGIEYSLEGLPGASITLTAVEKDEDCRYCCLAENLFPNTVYYYRAFILYKGVRTNGVVRQFTTLDYTYSAEAVDLGLSVKWSRYNLGAANPEESGAYYAWGETRTKTDYSWTTYAFCNGSPYSITKYCTNKSYGTVDHKTTLETGPAGDDVASKKLGGAWRMPTVTEWQELFANCKLKWTTINGVSGMKITSRKTGYTDKWIFLPAAGYRSGTAFYSYGSYGRYWLSALDAGNSSFACNGLILEAEMIEEDTPRFFGFSVRPVMN